MEPLILGCRHLAFAYFVSKDLSPTVPSWLLDPIGPGTGSIFGAPLNPHRK
ncbi:unnamed protein product [Dovyalis caffra]|uniref:Uncharacterized protein n=1 Tax=Dovyalis caffra TaxID=77055 RepID=A0AAV1STZ5_9ROSI|nr:unnamed protein product [Dovyalis caffra]